MKLYALLLGILAVWRATHFVTNEEGPWKVFVRLRRSAQVGVWAGLLSCFYCLSLWLAAPVAWLLGESWRECFLLWLAVSGGAILLERATANAGPDPKAIFWEEPELHNGLLRKDHEPTPADNRNTDN